MPLIPALRKQAGRSLQVPGQPGLQGETLSQNKERIWRESGVWLSGKVPAERG